VLVLGDGRSNHANPRLDLFAEMAARARRVVWLCPEARGRWGTGDSVIQRYAPFCASVTHVVTALDLETTSTTCACPTRPCRCWKT
jgi:uncharacterized protein with von Willebrand factor type A (vWA) domain